MKPRCIDFFRPGKHLWLALWACWAMVAAQAQPIHQFSLNNGMTLIVKPDSKAPTAVHMVWVRSEEHTSELQSH